MLDQGNNYWWCLGIAGFLWLIVIGFLVTGKSFGKKSDANRADDPAGYWWNVLLFFIGAAGMTGLLVHYHLTR